MKNIDQSKIKVSINVENPDRGLYLAEYRGKKAYGYSETIARLSIVDELTYSSRLKKWEKEMKVKFKGMAVSGVVIPPRTLSDIYETREISQIQQTIEQTCESGFFNLKVVRRGEDDEDY